jgi:flavodoxin
MNDTLMVYYSFEGNMEFVAELLKKHCPGITMERLIPENESPKKGFGKYFVGGRSALFKEDPHLKPLKTSVDDYQRIIIGFPVWAGTCPPAVDAYLNSEKIKGKDIYVIACSASGKADKAIANIQMRLSDNANKGSLSLKSPLKNKNDTEEKVVSFLQENHLI